MKKILLLSVSLLFIASLAFAQAGSIGLFINLEGTNCDVYDYPGIVLIYVVHVYTPGATAAQFRVVCGWGAEFSLLSEAVTPPYISSGNSQTGIAIAYGTCVASPNMILTLSYFAQGLSKACSYCQVMDDLTVGPPGIYVADCASPPNLLTATGGDVVINPDATCMCNIPVEETSWGHVKALYHND